MSLTVQRRLCMRDIINRRSRLVAAKSAAEYFIMLDSRTAAGVAEELWGVSDERADY